MKAALIQNPKVTDTVNEAECIFLSFAAIEMP